MPKCKITARSCGPTVTAPDARNTTTRTAMMILTKKKLLPSASASAREPESSAEISGAGF